MAACLSVSLVVIVAFAHTFGLSATTSAAAELRNALHPPAFALLSIALYLVLRQACRPAVSVVLAALLAFAAGLGGEVLQYRLSRTASLEDLLRDGSGIALGLAAAVLTLERSWRPLIRCSAAAAAAIALLLLLLQPAAILLAFAERNRVFPMLFTFDEDWQARFYSPANGARIEYADAPSAWPTGTRRVAVVSLSAKRYSGLSLEPPEDWRDYAALTFTVASANGDDAHYSVRIHDARHNGDFSDRYNGDFVASAKPRKIRIPLDAIRGAPESRSMDLATIREIVIFLPEAGAGEQLLLDDMRLENE